MRASPSTGADLQARRARLRRRALAGAAAAITVAGLLGAGSSGPAVAGGTGTPSAVAQSTAVNPGSGLVFTTVSSSGLLGALTGSITTGIINAAASLPNTILAGISNALNTTANLSAANSANQQPRPSPVDNYPTCGVQGWTSPGNCFALGGNSTAPILGAGSLVAASGGSVQGYATGDSQGYVGAAGIGHASIVVPGLTIDLGVASSNSQCTASVCTPSQSLSNASITSGGVTKTLALATGGALATIGSTTIANAATIPVFGNAVTATANGNLLTLNVSLSLDTFLSTLGTSLATLSSGLTQGLADNGSSISLTITLGPGSISSSGGTQASAWGLEVGINLVADIKLNATSLLGGLLGGLVGSTELKTVNAANYPANGSSPDLLDLQFAYSKATAGALIPDFVPPAII